MLRVVHEAYLPNKMLIVADAVDDMDEDFAHLPLGEMTQLDGKATAYVCSNFACSAPTTEPDGLTKMLT
jgi:uncharacterized protein YyaL (SSP411 family)